MKDEKIPIAEIYVPAKRQATLNPETVEHLAAAILENRDNIVAYFAEAGLVTLVLNLVVMALAFAGAAAVGVGRPQRIALSLECGLQNGTFAIAVVSTLGLPSVYAIPAATYSLIMFATAIAFAWAVARGARPVAA